MRAFVYTLVLTAILVVSVVFLRSLDRSPKTAKEPLTPRSSPMVVHSEPAERSNIDPEVLRRTNNEALYETGVELLDLWHVPEAIDVFETLVEKDSSEVAAWLRLTEAYAHPTISLEARAAAALASARDAAVETGADTTLVHVYRRLFIDHSPQDAVEALAGTSSRSDDPETLYLRAAALLAADRAQDAERALLDLLGGDQSLGRARELLVQCEVARGDLEAAEQEARRLASLYPEEPYPYVLLSRVLLARGRVSEAVEFSNNALLLDNRYVPAIVARARLYVSQGETEAARVAFEKLLLFDEPVLGSIGTEGLAYVDFFTGHFDEAAREMDEAIRLSMSVNSTRMALAQAFRLVEYLCELGRMDAAEAVVDRWLSRHGRYPEQIARLRIRIEQGDLVSARHMLREIEGEPAWKEALRDLDIDYPELAALTFMRGDDLPAALAELEKGSQGRADRRAYLKGIALFKSGQAEQASASFEAARSLAHGITFPYDHDPILAVQSVFFLAETAIARGEVAEAQRNYKIFLDRWGEADWDLQAVARARQKLQTLSPAP